MSTHRGAALTVVATCLGLVLAVPAVADEGFNGVYTYTPELGDTATVRL
jgi:hypothetical protein